MDSLPQTLAYGALGRLFEQVFGDNWNGARFDSLIETESIDNPHALGGWTSFVPELGVPSWRAPGTYVQGAARHENPFRCAVYLTESGRRIGYLRVPHYLYSGSDAVWLAKLVEGMERVVDVLVLDQVNNPGGSIGRMYDLVACLTDRPLEPPKHEFALTEDDVERAKDIVMLGDYAQPDAPPEDIPEPGVLAYSRFVVAEFQSGRARFLDPDRLVNTEPGFLMGIEKIVPSARPYTGDLVVLINEVTFSAPEFLAAIMQDNKRALIFGSRSAGAGGLVRRVPSDLEDRLGMELTLTWTLARRMNGVPIENRGVQPDQTHELTVDDIRSNYSPYRDALLSAVEDSGFSDR